MKHVMYGGKPFLLDDDSTALLLDYASRLPALGAGDTVTINAVGPDGSTVEVTVLLNAATELIAETTRTEMTPPDNATAIKYLQGRLELLANPPSGRPVDPGDTPADFE